MADVNPVYEDFASPSTHWRRHVVGVGALEATGSSFRFITDSASSQQYSNAQIDDYQALPRRQLLWQPPLRLTVRARFSHPAGGNQAGLTGTAGFGFWNDPFLMTGVRIPTLPRALWFFYASPPSNMKLDLDTPGHGWKVATIDALRPIALLLASLALPATLLMNIRSWYHRLWPSIQRSINVREALIPVDMTAWHTYSMEWDTNQTRFYTNSEGEQPDTLVLEAPSPRGPLGFVMWLDNQYMVATPQGQLQWGLLDVEGHQWMEVDTLSIEPGQGGP